MIANANANDTPAYKLTCITPGCEVKQLTRGVCQTCYQAAKRLTQSGKATDEQLVSLGLLLPKKHRAFASRFLQEFEKRRDGVTGVVGESKKGRKAKVSK